MLLIIVKTYNHQLDHTHTQIRTQFRKQNNKNN